MISKSDRQPNGAQPSAGTLHPPAAGPDRFATRWDPPIVPFAVHPKTRTFPWHLFLTALTLASLFTTFLLLVQFSIPGLVGNDGYYHIKLAYLMRTQGLKPFFEWLPLTVLNPVEFVDHHFLYHVLLIPFTFGDLRMGAKLASVIFPSLTFMALWWLLRGQRLPLAAFWAGAVLVLSEAFIYRMSMPRAQSLSLAVLLLGLHWLLTGKHRRLLPLAFLYVWLYNAFPLLLVFAGVYTGARWLLDGRLDWKPLIYTGLGIGLGLVINPYFPQNLIFIYRHLAPKLADPTAIRVGNEWYPYDTNQLFGNSGLALLAFAAGVFALGLRGRRMDVRTGTSLLLAFIFGALLFQSRRFIEYFPPFALVLAAFAWTPILQRGLPQEDLSARAPGQRHGAFSRLRLPGWSRQSMLAGAALLILMPALWFNLGASRESVGRASPYERYQAAATWLEANTSAGTRVFQTDWDDFPRLFYFNTHNVYTIGLDPTYMQLFDPNLYDLWTDITKGQVDDLSAAIRERFRARYVFTDLKHDAFIKDARVDPYLVEVYQDEYALIFEVLPADATH